MRGLAAMRGPKCAGAAMSRALLVPILDWPAPSVACVKLSSVRPGRAAQETAALPRRRFLQPAVPEELCGRALAGCG